MQMILALMYSYLLSCLASQAMITLIRIFKALWEQQGH